MHGEKVGGDVVSFSRRIKHCRNIINALLLKKRLFYNSKTRFSYQRIVSGNKANVAKICVARKGDPCLKPRSFSQPQIIFQQFCFHEIRLTDKML